MKKEIEMTQTSQELYDALLQARQEIQAENIFLERMSHEIRTPMNSIIGLTYLSKENIDNQKQVLENLDKIEKSAYFLRSFIDDILNLSLLESGRVADNKKTTCFRCFLEELSEEIKSRAGEKQIRFSMETRGAMQKSYCFDSEKLKEALLHILKNAIRFTPAGGRVDFIAELLREDEKEEIFRFEIRDTGIGMSADFIAHAFDAFEQEEKAVTTLEGGTGLGLTIAKNILDFMGGNIQVYSRKNTGTTVVVTLPLARSEETAGAPGTQEKDYDFSGKRILLVEDSEINIEITRNILVHKNFTVDVAVNGQEGVDCFLGHEAGYYDAILMDIRMPVLDGLKATQMIRNVAHADSMKIPIIAMTANVFEEDVRKSLEAGMNAHLNKPVDIRQMYELLAQLILN